MALSCDNGTDSFLYRDTTTALGVDFNAAWTVCFHIFVDSSLTFNNTGGLFRAGDTGVLPHFDGDFAEMTGTLSAPTLMLSTVHGGTDYEDTSAEFTEDVWHSVWIVRASATDIKLYIDGVEECANTHDVAARSQIAGWIGLGAITVPTDAEEGTFPGLIDGCKLWSGRALSTDELERESQFRTPQSPANLYLYTPIFDGTKRIDDLSGNDRDWSENGTIADGDPRPDQRWTRRPGDYIFIAAAGGADNIACATTGASTMVGAITARGAIDAATTGSSTMVGAITARGKIAGPITGATTAAGAITARGKIAGPITGATALAGTITARGKIAGPITGSSTAAGTVTARGTIAAATTGGCTISGTVTGRGKIECATTGSTTMVGAIIGNSIECATTGSSTLTGSVVDANSTGGYSNHPAYVGRTFEGGNFSSHKVGSGA